MKGKNKIIKLIAQIIGWAALALSVIFAVIYYLNIKDDAAVSANAGMMINWAFILIGASLLVAFIIAPIVSIISNPQTLIKGFISIGVLAVVVIIAFSVSKGDISTLQLINIDQYENLEKKLTFTETGLFTLYIFVGLAILGIIVSEVKALLKM